MQRKRMMVLFAAAMACVSGFAGAQTPQQQWTQVGVLSCKVNANIGFILVGHQPMECLFQPGPALRSQMSSQAYEGAINTVGVDVGVTAESALAWAVFAPTVGLPAGALAGEYVGVSGDVGIGLGAGANVLLGGSGRTIALQPLSVQGSVAVNVVLGLSALKLRVAS
jgi:hypothetical protein